MFFMGEQTAHPMNNCTVNGVAGSKITSQYKIIEMEKVLLTALYIHDFMSFAMLCGNARLCSFDKICFTN